MKTPSADASAKAQKSAEVVRQAEAAGVTELVSDAEVTEVSQLTPEQVARGVIEAYNLMPRPTQRVCRRR